MVSRRNFLKFVGIGIAILFGFYFVIKELLQPKPISKKKIKKPSEITPTETTPSETTKEQNQLIQNSYYKIYIENDIAKALNVKKNSIDYQNSNHVQVIQSSLDALPPRTQKLIVSLIGDFEISSTIKIPSYTIFNLQGSITLANNVNQVLLQEIDHISGITQIEMIGGTYDGNATNQTIDNFGINFTKVTNSRFSNFISQNAGKGCFVLDTDCNNNTCDNLTGRSGGTGININNGNGLDDRGNDNTWTNCIAEDNVTDNWVIKSRNSNFINCIGRGSKNAVGFGLFADRKVTGNKLVACSGYNNKSTGVTLNIPSKSNGRGFILESNSIQGEFYNNGTSGIRFINETLDGSLSGNTFDVLVHDNTGTGFLIDNKTNIDNNSGTIVSHDNGKLEANIQGESNNFDIYVTDRASAGNIQKAVNNAVNINQISCQQSSQLWSINKYCQK